MDETGETMWVICKGSVNATGGYYSRGDWIQVPIEEGKRLISEGKAELTDPPKRPERGPVIRVNPFNKPV